MTPSRRRLWPALIALLFVVSAASGVAAASVSGERHPAAASESATLVFGGPRHELEAGPGQVVRGETALPAGTPVDVYVQSTDDESPRFIRSEEAVVAADGTFRATFDLSSVAGGRGITVSVHGSGGELASETGATVECADACANPDPASPSATIDAEDENVTLSAGPGRTVRGTTNLTPGTTLSVRLVGTGDRSFVYEQSAVVGADGRFRGTFDLSSVPAPQPATVTVTQNGTQLTSRSGTIRPCQSACSPPPTESTDSGETERNETLYDDLNTVEATQGEIARIELTFEPETSTLTIGGPTVSYALNLSVTDGNDDDTVTVLFATDRVGHGDDAVSVANDSDGVSVIDERVDGDRDVLDEGEYPLRQSVGPLTQQRDDDSNTFLVETGELKLQDAPVDGDSGEEVVSSAGFEHQRSNGSDLGPKPVRVRMNETTRIPVKTDESKAVTVIVGAYDSPYTLTAVVADGNGDERVDLVFDSTTASEDHEEAPVSTVNDSDSVVVTYENGSLAPATYQVLLYRRAGLPAETEWRTSHSGAGEIFGRGEFIVTEGDSTPDLETQSPSSSTDGLPVLSIGILALSGVLATLGIGLVTGVFRR